MIDVLINKLLLGLVVGSTGGAAFGYWFISKIEHRPITLRAGVYITTALAGMVGWLIYLGLSVVGVV